MSWFKRKPANPSTISTDGTMNRVRLALEGWSETRRSGAMRVWKNGQGDVLTLATADSAPRWSDEEALRQWGRDFAESRQSGLIEVNSLDYPSGAMSVVSKKAEGMGFVFSGMLIIPEEPISQIWTIMSGERGLTGVREAIITTELLKSGELTIDSYRESRARDPYDSSYEGVDRKVLRFISDDRAYDGRFPDHPLSKVRRVLSQLPQSISMDASV